MEATVDNGRQQIKYYRTSDPGPGSLDTRFKKTKCREATEVNGRQHTNRHRGTDCRPEIVCLQHWSLTSGSILDLNGGAVRKRTIFYLRDDRRSILVSSSYFFFLFLSPPFGGGGLGRGTLCGSADRVLGPSPSKYELISTGEGPGNGQSFIYGMIGNPFSFLLLIFRACCS